MIDMRFYRMAAVFFLTLSVSIFAWYYTYSFTLMEKFLPMEFQVHEEFVVAEAILNNPQIDGQVSPVAAAIFNAAKYKKEELKSVIESATQLHSLSRLVGAYCVLLSILFFGLEMIDSLRAKKRVRVGC